ncbi:MAG: hypothetical protein JXA18_17495 [Chitinispirillaceae bacterium]|nr:hypothetical protein [Chitinispirillaceae bacterium]
MQYLHSRNMGGGRIPGILTRAIILLPVLLLLIRCHSAPTAADDPAESGAFVIVHLQNACYYWNPATGSDTFGLNIHVHAQCVGSPWPRIHFVTIGGVECIYDREFFEMDGITFEGYYLTDSLFEKRHVAVVTDLGVAEADIALPRQRVIINEPSTSDIDYGSDITVRWTGDAEHYRVMCDLQDSLYHNFALIDTVLDDTCLFVSASRLTDKSYGFDVSVAGYNGSVPRPGAVANMNGALRGFLAAQNSDVYNFQEFFIVR